MMRPYAWYALKFAEQLKLYSYTDSRTSIGMPDENIIFDFLGAALLLTASLANAQLAQTDGAASVGIVPLSTLIATLAKKPGKKFVLDPASGRPWRWSERNVRRSHTMSCLQSSICMPLPTTVSGVSKY